MRGRAFPRLAACVARVGYLEALNRANTGRYTPLVNLLGQAVEAVCRLLAHPPVRGTLAGPPAAS